MKKNLSYLNSNFFIVYLLIIIFANLSYANDYDIIYTDTSVDFYGYADSIYQGDIITVYDPDNVLCGKFIANKDGIYGVIHVYGDDITSLDVDEGAQSGDELFFYRNGEKMNPKNHQIIKWTQNRDSIELNFD